MQADHSPDPITRVWGVQIDAHAPILALVRGWCQDNQQTAQVALFAPVPIDARPCQRPGLIRAEVLVGNRSYSVTLHNSKLESNLPT